MVGLASLGDWRLCTIGICESICNLSDELSFETWRSLGRYGWWRRCWNFWQFAQIAWDFQLIVNFFDTSNETVGVFVCSTINNGWSFDAIITTKFTDLLVKWIELLHYISSCIPSEFANIWWNNGTYSVVMQNTSIGWHIQWTSSSHKFPYEMITGFNDCIWFANIFRSLFLRMQFGASVIKMLI